MDKIKILVCLLHLSLLMGCSEVVPLFHDSSQKSKAYPNLGTIKVDLFDEAKPQEEKNGSLKFTPAIDTFFLSTIKTKIVQSNLFTLSDPAEYELSGKINKFQSASILSTGRLVFGCLGLAVYLAGSVLAIAKSDATYFYVGTGVTPLIIGTATFFDSYYQADVGFEYTIRKKGVETYRDSVYADSTLENPKHSREVLLDQLSNECVDQMLKQMSENVK